MPFGYLTIDGGWTIEAWFNRDTLPGVGGQAVLLGQHTQGSKVTNPDDSQSVQGRQFTLGVDSSGAWSFVVSDDGEPDRIDYTSATGIAYFSDSKWHHVAVVLKAANKRDWALYVDGVLVGSGTASAVPSWKPGRLAIGAMYAPQRGNFGARLWDKKVAYVAAIDKEISQERIIEHYNAGAGKSVYYGDDEVTRISRVLDWANVPESHRLLDDPVTTLQGIAVTNSNALEKAQEAGEAARGLVFADGTGHIRYQSRRRRYNRHQSYRLAESLGSAPEVGIQFATNKQYIYNDIRGSRTATGTTDTASVIRMQNEVSIDTYGRKVYTFTVPLTDPEELKSMVAWLLARYGEDQVRISNVKFRIESSSELRRLMETVEVGDLIVLDELTDPAPAATMEFLVEQITCNVNFLERKWEVGLALSPHSFNRSFQIGVSQIGGADPLGM